jgi:hypothetical protein
MTAIREDTMSEQIHDPKDETRFAALLARLETLAARVEAQDVQIAHLTAQVSSSAVKKAAAPSCAAGSTRDARTGDDPAASRRDVLRYGAIALGAAAVGLTARPAEAADGDPVLLGVVNLGTIPTSVESTAINSYALRGITSATGSAGLFGSAGGGVDAKGLSGLSTGYGVYGVSNSPGGTGVFGFNNMVTGANFGVRGAVVSPAGFAVYGRNDAGGTVVLGEVPASTNQNGIALYGLNNSTYAGAAPGAGGFGVYGLSAKGHGLVGATASTGGAAVVGASNGVAGAFAGAFYGSVVVSGGFTVVGGPKSAAVPHPDGSHRRLYCLESPESWFEDFGRGQLECGQADVLIDPDFAAVVDLDEYQVFVTEYGQHSDLCVTDQTATGFRVQAKDDAARGRFGWRIVARRKDIRGERLAPVTIPPEPTLPPVPDHPSPIRADMEEL